MRRAAIDEKGAALVEFAMVLLPLIILVFGILEFGLLLFNKQVITNAAREGARGGIVNQAPRIACDPDSDPAVMTIAEVVSDYCASNLITFSATPSPPSITCRHNGALFSGSPTVAERDDLRVEIAYTYDYLYLPNFVTSLAGGTVLQAFSVMKYE